MGEAEQAIDFTGVGRDLRAAREAIGKQIKDASTALRIAGYHLEALEAGRYDDLPEPVYIHGFVRSYAGYLSLDADEMVRRVRLELLPPIVPEELHFPAASQDSPKPSRNLLILALLLTVAVIGFWYLGMGSDRDGPPDAAAVAPEAKSEQAVAPPAPAAMDEAQLPPLPPAAEVTESSPESEAAAPQIPSVDELVGQTNSAPAAAATEESTADAGAFDEQAPGNMEDTATSGDDSAILAEEIGTPELSSQAGLSAGSPMSRAGEAIMLPPSPPLVAEPATAPAPSETTAAQPAATATQQSENAEVNQPASLQALTRAPVVLRASADTWMQISQPDGAVLKSWVMRAGEQYVPPAGQSGLTAMIGNAGALKIIIDGAEMPPLGAKGVVVRAVPLDAADLKSRFGG